MHLPHIVGEYCRRPVVTVTEFMLSRLPRRASQTFPKGRILMFGRRLPPLEVPRLPHFEVARLCGHLSVDNCSEQILALVIAARDISRTQGREIPGSVCLGLAALAIVPLVNIDVTVQSTLLAARDTSDPAGLFSRLRAAAEPCDILYSLVGDVGCAFSKWLCKTGWMTGGKPDLFSTSPAYWQARLASLMPDMFRKALASEHACFSGIMGIAHFAEAAPGSVPSSPYAPGDPDAVWVRMHGMFPWMTEANSYLCGSLARVNEGKASRIPPMLLHGDAGIGKTFWCLEAASALGMHPVLFPVGGATSGAAVTGFEKTWTMSEPSLAVKALCEAGNLPVAVIVDDLDKGSTTDSGGSVPDALLPLLEQVTAARYRDLQTGTVVDASGIAWMMTCNSLSPFGQPLLSRVETIRVGKPDRKDVLKALSAMHAAHNGDPATLEADLAAMASAYTRDGNLRSSRRELEGILRGRSWSPPASHGVEPVLSVVR